MLMCRPGIQDLSQILRKVKCIGFSGAKQMKGQIILVSLGMSNIEE